MGKWRLINFKQFKQEDLCQSQRLEVGWRFQGLGEGENEELLLMDTEFQFGKRKSSADRRWRWLYNNVNVLNTTDDTLRKW